EIKEGRRTSIIGDKTVCVYELKTKSLIEMSRSVSYAELLWRGSPSHERLVALGYCGSALWDAETGELLQEIHKYLRCPVQSNGVLSPDGRLLAIGTEDGVAVVYSVSDARLLWKKRCHLSWLQTLAFTSDSRKLASAGDDHAILISDAETGELLQTLMGRIPSVEAISFMQDGKHVSALYDDDSARLWSVEAHSLEKYKGAGHRFLGLMQRKTSQIARHYWSPAFKDLLASLQHSPYWGLQAISHDGTLVSLVAPRGGYFFGGRDFQTDEEEEDAPAPNPVPTLASSLEDALHKHLHNTCGNKLIIAVWSTESRSIRYVVPIAESSSCVLFPDNRRCAVAHEKQVAIYSLETGKVLQQFQTDIINDAELTLSNDGNLLAAVYGYMGHLIVWDIRTGKKLDTDDIWADDGLDIAFYPDGDRIITSLPHREYAWIGRLSTKSETIILEGHLASVRAVACSPDGKLVATGAQDGAVKVWDATSGELLATYQALPEAEAWVVHTPEGEVTGSPGAEAYLMEE
ncbi:MAG: PQQ-binding-like beta-propeller repeat protein, partial [Armatimonadetes bacterium]|nr:PQQ-binding-like beta-propeller repeat protein [Armatimonadota bacterium]